MNHIKDFRVIDFKPSPAHLKQAAKLRREVTILYCLLIVLMFVGADYIGRGGN